MRHGSEKDMSATERRNQLLVLGALIEIYAILVFLTYTVFSSAIAEMAGGALPATASPDDWVFALISAAFVVVIYGLAGLAGFWFARKLGRPGIYRVGAGWKELFWLPLLIGVVVGVLLVLGDRLFMWAGDLPPLPHPGFPFSLVASASAGIGEEIIFRGFVMGLWAFLLNLVLRRWRMTHLALWIANIIAALAFAAGHLPTVLVLYGASSPAELPGLLVAEIFVLNAIVSLAAGWRYMTSGLVAAIGIHFWADIVWHVIWPLV